METNHGKIEHERNLNQGKRPDQLECSHKFFAYASVGMVIVLLIHWLFEIL